MSTETEEQHRSQLSSPIVSRCICGNANIQIFPDRSSTNANENIVNQQESATDENTCKVSAAAVAADVDSIDLASAASDCHCPKCRKFHAAAFVSYLEVPNDQLKIETSVQPLVKYRETCDEWGVVDRVACPRCLTKLLTVPVRASKATTQGQSSSDKNDQQRMSDKDTSNQTETDPSDADANTTKTDGTNGTRTVLVNMGPLQDKTIPSDLANAWKSNRNTWQDASRMSWSNIQPEFDWDKARLQRRQQMQQQASTVVLTGGCACQKCRFEFRFSAPSELQHCYCRLCRRLSGGPYMTWIPVYNTDFRWTATPASANANKNEPPPLMRSTNHGRRHVCPSCGTAMTIVYDAQTDMTWPAAGTIDDDSWPAHLSPYLGRVIHICHRYRQTWYELPNDGLPRVDEAC